MGIRAAGRALAAISLWIGTTAQASAQEVWEASSGIWDSADKASGFSGGQIGGALALAVLGLLGFGWMALRLERSNKSLAAALEKVKEQERVLSEAKESLDQARDSLEIARAVGNIGYWEWRLSEGSMTWSDEVYGIFGLERDFEPSRKGILSLVHPDDRDKLDAALGKALGSASGEYEIEFRILAGEGAEPKWALEVGKVISGRGGLPEKIAGTIRDTTLERQAIERLERKERELWEMANYDALTGLSNRRMIEDRIHRALVEQARTGKIVGALFIDIDRFRRIADGLGAESGDQLLLGIAGRLSERLRETDSLARLGGDRFLAILGGLDDDLQASAAARGLLETLKEPFEIDGEEFSLTASAGIALGPKDGETPQKLIQAAESAMDRVKKEGGEAFGFYREDMTRAMEGRLRMEGKLREAIRRGHFELRIQPQVSMRPGERGMIRGGEALVRWNDPEEGLISPASFIPLAEDTGLIAPIGEWVFREVCELSRIWERAGILPEDFRLSVNVSPRQLLRGGFASLARDVCSEGHPGGIVVELTESAAMEKAALDTLETLRILGLEISIDDFGTGYSSLSRLMDLPISEIKIDKAFVDKIGDGGEAICEAVIALGRGMGMRVVAEGIETEGQERFLESVRCEIAQGYRYAMPSTLEDFEAMLRSGEPLLPSGDWD